MKKIVVFLVFLFGLNTFSPLSEKVHSSVSNSSFSDIQNIIPENEKNKLPEYEGFYNALINDIELGNPFGVTNDLINLSEFYWKIGNANLALILLEKAGNLSKENEDSLGQFLTSNSTGDIFLEAGLFSSAKEKYEDALNIARGLKDENKIILMLTKLGKLHFDSFELKQAQEYFQKALPLSLAIEDKRIETKILNDLALVYYMQEDRDKAIDTTRKAFKLASVEEDSLFLIDSINQMAQGMFQVGLYTGASEMAKLSENFSRKIGYIPGIKHSLEIDSVALANHGKINEALQQALTLLEIQKNFEDEFDISMTLVNISLLYTTVGKLSEAHEYLNQSEAIANQLLNNRLKAAVSYVKGHIYFLQADYPQALKLYRQSLSLIREAKYFPHEVVTLLSIGTLYAYQGEYEEADKKAHEASKIIIKKHPKTPILQLEAVNLFAFNEWALGRYSESLSSYQFSLSLFNESIEGTARAKAGIGRALYALKRYSEALKIQKEAVMLFQESGNKVEEASPVIDLGNTYFSLNNLIASKENFEKALHISRDLGQRREEADALNGLGRIFEKLNKPIQAIEHFKMGIEIKREIGDRRGLVEIGYNLALLYGIQGKEEEALNLTQNMLLIAHQISYPRTTDLINLSSTIRSQ